MRIAIDQDKCIGVGLCVNSAEEVFDQREEDGIVLLLTANPSTEHEEAVREAALGCPVLAITISETC